MVIQHIQYAHDNGNVLSLYNIQPQLVVALLCDSLTKYQIEDMINSLAIELEERNHAEYIRKSTN